MKKRLFRNDPSSRYLWSLLWGQPKSAAKACWLRRLGGSPGWWLGGWVGAPHRHRRRPRVVVFVVIVVPGSHSFLHNFVSIFKHYPSPETKSLILLLHEHTIHSFILMHFISHWASFFLKIYLSIYLSIIISSSAFFAFLLCVFDPRSSICILVQISVVVLGACVCVICCEFEIISGIREGFEQLSRPL